MNTLSGAAAWSTVPASQQTGAVAISFQVIDQTSATAPPPTTAARTACANVLAGKTGSSPIYSFYPFCDTFFVLQSALAGHTSVSPGTLLAGADKLGCSVDTTNLDGPVCFGPGKYDGASYIQDLKWSTSANNWVSVGNPVAIP